MDKYNQFLPIMKTISMKLYYLMLGSVYGDVYSKGEIVSRKNIHCTCDVKIRCTMFFEKNDKKY